MEKVMNDKYTLHQIVSYSNRKCTFISNHTMNIYETIFARLTSLASYSKDKKISIFVRTNEPDKNLTEQIHVITENIIELQNIIMQSAKTNITNLLVYNNKEHDHLEETMKEEKRRWILLYTKSYELIEVLEHMYQKLKTSTTEYSESIDTQLALYNDAIDSLTLEELESLKEIQARRDNIMEITTNVSSMIIGLLRNISKWIAILEVAGEYFQWIKYDASEKKFVAVKV